MSFQQQGAVIGGSATAIKSRFLNQILFLSMKYMLTVLSKKYVFCFWIPIYLRNKNRKL